MVIITLLLVLLGLIPGVAWLFFYLQEDARHPEPKRLIAYTFLVGALITVFVLQSQIFINYQLRIAGFGSYSFLAFLFFAAIEEFFKFFAVYITVSRRKEFDEPIDAMIYMIVSALGFATVENVASVFQSSSGFFPELGPLETSILRFVGATLLHSLTSGIVGYYWGRALARKIPYGASVTWGLVVATLLHAIFNYLIIKSEPVALPLVFLLFIALFVLNDFEKLKEKS